MVESILWRDSRRLPEVTSDQKRALEKAWRRQDIDRYLGRWKGTQIPPVPQAFFEYEWRACDIGCGYGKYVLHQSGCFPERAYLGVDKGTRRGGAFLNRVKAALRKNVFGVHTNATPFLCQMPPECLNEITIFYPNPWWPQKHRSKRWAYHAVFPTLCALICVGGSIIVCSNEAEYLSEWAFAMDHHPAAHGWNRTYVGPPRTEMGRTHFEAKFIESRVVCGEVCYLKSS